jgi:hypothetical protein
MEPILAEDLLGWSSTFNENYVSLGNSTWLSVVNDAF